MYTKSYAVSVYHAVYTFCKFITLFDCPCCYNVLFFLKLILLCYYIVEKRNAEIKQLELELELLQSWIHANL